MSLVPHNPQAGLVHIGLGDRSNDIRIAPGLMANPDAWRDLPKAAAALIVTNDTVAPLYLAQLQAALQPHYAKVHVCTLPDGEAYKTWETLQSIFDGSSLRPKNCFVRLGRRCGG